MSLDTHDQSRDTGNESRTQAMRIDQATVKRWLAGEVQLTMPRWVLVTAGLLALMLLLAALD